MRKLCGFIAALALLLIVAGCGGGGGGGGGGAVNFPTPTLPAGAVKIDATNAEAIANSALEFTGILFGFAAKTEGPPSIPQVIKLVTDQVTKRKRNLGSKTAGKTEDVSVFFCVTGTAIDTFTENATSVSGEIKFADCEIFAGLFL